MIKKVLPSLLLIVLLMILGRSLSLNPRAQNHLGEGQMISDFSAFDAKTKSMVNSSHWQGNWYLLHFWASWCDSCQMEFSTLQKYQSYLPILGVAYKDSEQESSALMRVWGKTFAAWFSDPKGQLGLELGVTGTPETFLVNPDGRITYRYQGPLTDKIFQTEILSRVRG